MKKIEYSFDFSFAQKIVDTIKSNKLLPPSDFELPAIEGVVDKLTLCEELPEGDFFFIRYKPIPQFVLLYNLISRIENPNNKKFPSNSIAYKLAPNGNGKMSDVKVCVATDPSKTTSADIFRGIINHWLQYINKQVSDYNSYRSAIEPIPEVVNFDTDEKFTEMETEIIRSHLAQVLSNAKERIRISNKEQNAEIIEEQFNDISIELSELAKDTKTQTKFEWLKNYVKRIVALIEKYKPYINILKWVIGLTIIPHTEVFITQNFTIDFDVDFNWVPNDIREYIMSILMKGVNSLMPKSDE